MRSPTSRRRPTRPRRSSQRIAQTSPGIYAESSSVSPTESDPTTPSANLRRVLDIPNLYQHLDIGNPPRFFCQNAHPDFPFPRASSMHKTQKKSRRLWSWRLFAVVGDDWQNSTSFLSHSPPLRESRLFPRSTLSWGISRPDMIFDDGGQGAETQDHTTTTRGYIQLIRGVADME